jgi:hypothetical protein
MNTPWTSFTSPGEIHTLSPFRLHHVSRLLGYAPDQIAFQMSTALTASHGRGMPAKAPSKLFGRLSIVAMPSTETRGKKSGRVLQHECGKFAVFSKCRMFSSRF